MLVNNPDMLEPGKEYYFVWVRPNTGYASVTQVQFCELWNRWKSHREWPQLAQAHNSQLRNSMIVRYVNGEVATISLVNANVLPSRFSCHRLFTTRDEAIEYAHSPIEWQPLSPAKADARPLSAFGTRSS